uniref:BEL1-like homeodomain protein 4 n=1 Tax=Erigeron canadensis TaxID=72917 RepID=UPI001CB8A0D4|nr:BEL1-like homeodomain protein 4 [Erigeron canadensis]
MSQDYIFNFSHGFERSSSGQDQIRRLDEEAVHGNDLPAVYETGAGMLSEMFNFSGPNNPNSASELLANQINYHQQNRRPNSTGGDWYGNSTNHAMQLFLTNPSHHQESPSSESPSSTLHMLMPNNVPSTNSTLHHQQSFGSTSGTGQGHFGQFAWVPPGGGTSNEGENVGGVEGLSLSLSSTLQHHLEAAKVEDLRIGDDSGTAGMFYFNQLGATTGGDPYRSLHMGQPHNHGPIHIGFGSSSLGVVKVLRNSRYVKAAQELLEEFCSVGRGQFKKNKSALKSNNPTNSSGGGASSKELPPLSSSDRIEHQRRKVKLSSMLDEVERRYNHYCEQMQMVVNSFDLVMGFGGAVPYTALAQKAMSRHFRCLKDAIAAQLKHSCELLGEKDASSSGVTKGETPRLKLLEQSLRQQRAFHQMGMMEQEAWRPQRGLPERSVNILRAWLFEHFLHPYPSDADKHLLARQTGLSRNQVSNWFINARVRLWKPMVEDMYQQESKEEDQEGIDPPQNIDQNDDDDEDIDDDQENNNNNNKSETNNNNINYKNGPSSSSTTTSSCAALAQTSMHHHPPIYTNTHANISEINDPENDPSILAINTQNCFSENQVSTTTNAMSSSYSYTTGNINNNMSIIPPSFPVTKDDVSHDQIGSTLIRFGTNSTSGDVSLTLGLRHAGSNLPEKNSFSVRDFGEC